MQKNILIEQELLCDLDDEPWVIEDIISEMDISQVAKELIDNKFAAVNFSLIIDDEMKSAGSQIPPRLKEILLNKLSVVPPFIKPTVMIMVMTYVYNFLPTLLAAKILPACADKLVKTIVPIILAQLGVTSATAYFFEKIILETLADYMLAKLL